MGQIVDDVTSILDYRNADKDAKKAAESERKKILNQIAADEKQKANLVKKALATQRANFGASGASGKSMTDEAVLKRLREETAQPFDEKKRLNEEKIRSIKVDKSGKRNLLKFFLDQLPDIGFGTST